MAKSAQPEINIGLVGHVDHGKTTLTERLSGKWTDTHSEELRRGITIRLGYADATFVKTKDGKHMSEEAAKMSMSEYDVVRKVSFVDAPGHESLMATMLAGTTIMDGVLLLVAANEECPQPQTREHLMALDIMGFENVIVVQNKIDLVTKEQAMENYKQIKNLLKDTSFSDAPIVPISAQHNVNIDALIELIEEKFPTPKRDSKAEPLMYIARSFDINKPGQPPENMVGGVLGGAVVQGELKKSDKIEIRPGRKIEEHNQIRYEPLTTTIEGLRTGGEKVDKVSPGGSVGVMTLLDPSIVKSDSLAGSLVGMPGKLPPVWETLKLEVNLLERIVGVEDDITVENIKMNEPLMLNVNSAATVGVVTELGKGECTCVLKLPVCAKPGSRVAISRRVVNRFRLIGYGVIKE